MGKNFIRGSVEVSLALNSFGHGGRLRYEISAEGLHWEDLDEEISIPGLLAGRGDQTKPLFAAAE